MKDGIRRLHITSRRVAREWAVKIIYQQDVGHTTLDEVTNGALNRLRMEFVVKGSRRASGSELEYVALDIATHLAEPYLAEITEAGIWCVSDAAARVIEDAGYWYENRMERMLKLQLPATSAKRLFPYRSLSDLLNGEMLAAASPKEQSYIPVLVDDLREKFANVLDAHVRKMARITARKWIDSCLAAPVNTAAQVLNDIQTEWASNQRCQFARAGETVKECLSDYLGTAAYCYSLVRGVDANLPEIDAAIKCQTQHWAMERQAAVDRNILRLACYELLKEQNAPGIVINEAVELAKKYSTENSGKFINGVLGGITLSAKPVDVASISEDDSVHDGYSATGTDNVTP